MTSLSYANGDSYVGQVSTTYSGITLPHGYGTMTRPNGDFYTGNFFEGRRHGQGQSYSVAIQRHYSGGFVYDKEEGYATITCPGVFGGQRQYVGTMSNNQRHGQGILWETKPGGETTMYEGLWVNDQLNGPGKFSVTDYKSTCICEGVFVNGRLEGVGTYSNSPFGPKYNATFQGGNVIPWNNWCY
jgi:hypothetical protein